MGRRGRAAFAAALLGALVPVGMGAQEPGSFRAVARVEPDTVRVGEPFLLGVAMENAPEAEFPVVLPLGEEIEQLAAPTVTGGESPGVRRATYRLVAWRSGRVPMPELSLERGGGAALLVRPPTLLVRSVLPPDADPDTLDLREARPYLTASGFPWGWLLGALALAALGVWLWRRGRRTGEEGVPDPGARECALVELARLREDWTRGRVSGAGFYDRFEAILRGFGRAALGWPAGRPLRGPDVGGAELSRALNASARVRFARVRPADQAVREAVSAGRLWVAGSERRADAGTGAT